MTLLEGVAASMSAVSASELAPADVREVGRRLLDALGCMLGGRDGNPVRAAFASVGTDDGPATLVGDWRRSSPAFAALANCTSLRYLDYMDGHPGPYSCHPSLVIPPALAVAEATGATGLELARAIALGYEMDIRLQLGSGDPDITRHGFSGSTNLGLAVPVAVAGLLGLSEQELAHAMAISIVHAPTLDASGRGQMAESKSSVDGFVAMTGVTAAELARNGLTGKLAAVEGDDGFLSTVARRWDEAILLASIDRFRMMDAYVKQYNAVKCAQSAVSSALRLRSQITDLAQVQSITLRLAERDWRNQGKDVDARRRPRNRDTGNHSAVYCLAAALVDGQLTARQFEADRLADPTILALVDRTQIEPDPELTLHWPAANPASVTVQLDSGPVLTDTTLYSDGHPRNPITDQALEEKFAMMAEPVLGRTRAAEVVAVVRDLDGLDDVRELTRLLAVSPAGM
jgi:2-methylcitrate dehydratase